MNIKYLMLKDRYVFAYGSHLTLFNPEDEKKRSEEISLYLKELTLYGVSTKSLARQAPSPKIKNELLNISVICSEEKWLYELIRSRRKLPIKDISSFTKLSKSFIEKWQYYIIAYFLLLLNNNYYRLKSYLNIRNTKTDSKNSDVVAIQPLDKYRDNFTGIVIKTINESVLVITPQGDFIKLKPNIPSEASVGGICTGTIKKDIMYFKYPIIFACIGLFMAMLIFSFIYTRPKRTVLIEANSSIKIKANSWDRTVEMKSLSNNGSKITKNLSLFNKSVDDSIYLILKEGFEKAKITDKEGFEKAIITDKTNITIFMTGSKKESPILSKTTAYILEHNLQVNINNNGVEHKIKKTQK